MTSVRAKGVNYRETRPGRGMRYTYGFFFLVPSITRVNRESPLKDDASGIRPNQRIFCLGMWFVICKYMAILEPTGPTHFCEALAYIRVITRAGYLT